MHGSALDWVRGSFGTWKMVQPDGPINVLEFGSLDINGSVRYIFSPYIGSYIGLDLQDGPGVDVVADAATYDDGITYDVVVCCEVFEHTPAWPDIVGNAYNRLRVGGLFVATMAGEGRPPHSAIDENPIREWEYYGNVMYDDMAAVLRLYSTWTVDKEGTDLRCWAVK